MKTIIIALLFSLVLVSCQKDENTVKSNNPGLLGSWINPQYNDTLVTYDRAENLVENQYGITFKSGNKLVQRQNSGWCGTPPISTTDYEGTWDWNDSIINISVGYWGGTEDYTWKIQILNDQKLVISVVKSSFHESK